MTEARTPLQHRPIDPSWKAALGAIEVPSDSWVRYVASILLRLLRQAPSDTLHFPWAWAHWLRYQDFLRAMAEGAREIRASDLTRKYPVLTALAAHDRRDREESPPPLARLFAWLIFELHLRGQYRHSQEQLSEILRGLSRRGQQSDLIDSLGGAQTPHDLQEAMLRLAAGKPADASLTGHDSFDRLWRTELCAAVASVISSWAPDMGTEPEEESLASPVLASGDPDDEDTFGEMPFILVPPIRTGEPIPSPRSQVALAVALALGRSSTADILRHPDNIAPTIVVRTAWMNAHKHAEQELRRGDHAAARRQLVLLLAIEAGLSEAELPRLCIGSRASAQWLALDLSGRRLLRAETRPPKAFRPSLGQEGDWMETGADISFPLTDQTLRLAIRLMAARTDLAAERCPFVLLPGDRTDGKSVLRTALRESSPSSNYSPLIFRKRIASYLCALLGLDVAQMAFGDSFAMDSTGTYYCRISVSTIARSLSAEVARTTSGTFESMEEWASLKGYIGSAVVPANRPIAEYAERLPLASSPQRGRPNIANLLAEWKARRDRLAMHLVLATGHRPNYSLSTIILDDLAPNHALVVLRDKRSDPAHFTRFASTGWEFVRELRDYIAFLELLARNSAGPGVRQLVREILHSGSPLFRIIDAAGRPVDLDVPELFSSLPAPWNEKRNLHRHALCQHLVEIGVDPELRFTQMGWLLADGGGSSECAPYSPVEFTARLAPEIDACLRRMGWPVSSASGPVKVEFPTMPLVGWNERVRGHQNECDAQLRRWRVALAERRASVLPKVAEQLAEALKVNSPGFRLVSVSGRPALRAIDRNSLLSDRAPFSEALVGRLLKHVAPQGGPAIESAVATSELSRLLRDGISRGECRGFVPAVPRLPPAQSASPFLLAAGLAIRQADEVRDRLKTHLIKKAARDATGLAFAAWLAVMSMTPYRGIERARDVVIGIKGAVRAQAEDWCLRVPNDSGHVCLSGLPLLLMTKLQRELRDADLESVLTREEFGGWFATEFPGLVPAGVDGTLALSLLEQTLQVAGRFELPGIERTLLFDDSFPASVPATRAASVADGRTIPERAQPAGLPDASDDPHPEAISAPSAVQSHRIPETRHSLQLLPLFSNDYVGDIADEPALPVMRRRAQLTRAVADCRRRAGSRLTTDRLLLDYLLVLLGEERGSDEALRPGTIYTKAHRFAKRLLDLGLGAWDELSAEQVTTALHAVLLQAPSKIRVRVLAELKQFHGVSGRRYEIESPDWVFLCEAAGERWEGGDVAILGEHEVRRVARTLAEAVVPQADQLIVPMRERRLRELQRVGCALLDASGCRPRSIYGLTLADLHFDSAGDFIHLKVHGRFEAQKTPTAAGFVPLEGELWDEEREWLRRWHARLCEGRDPAELPTIPLFEEPGARSGSRFTMRAIFGPIGSLLRWSTSNGDARTYWLRKRRLQARHRQIQRLPNPTARDVVHVLRISGQRSIRTPLASYLHDTMCYTERSLRAGADAGRPLLAAVTGLRSGTIAQRARRLGSAVGVDATGGELRLVLEASVPAWMQAPDFDPGVAPDFAMRATGDLSTLSDAMICFSLGWDEVTTAHRSGISPEAAVQVRAAMDLMTRWTGYEFGMQEGMLTRPRSTSTNQVLLGLLGDPPPELGPIAAQWAQRANRVPIRAGCPLIDSSLEADLNRVLDAASLKSVRLTVNRTDVILPTHPDGTYGLWPALRWVLAVVWVSNTLSARG